MIPEGVGPGPEASRVAGRRLLWVVSLTILGALGAAMTLLALLGAPTRVVRLPPAGGRPQGTQESPREREAEGRLAGLRPRGRYIVIDIFHNRLRVYDGDRLLREAVCSTGSGTVLVHPEGSRTWVFDTPLGERRVLRKVRDPVWTKPDWAFIEEGFAPPRDPSERIDRVSLGDYALYLGDGYIIHGTLFQTLLGQGVTHGCVRLGDADLKYVYDTVPVGARVYLY